MRRLHVEVPPLVRLKPGALDRLGLYLSRADFGRAALFFSAGLAPSLLERARASLQAHGVECLLAHEVREATVEEAVRLLGQVPARCRALVGLGGGRALDVAKYTASLCGVPCLAVPTSLSNDGFCSPQASLRLEGRPRSLPTGLPYGVVVDLEVCRGAPLPLWHSGVGDLVAKLTAVADWKGAFHARGTPVNDLAALLSDATVYQFLASPTRDEAGIRLLATALMLNGVAMEIAGSSRPASGSEHLISHALDLQAGPQHLHGLQTGTAAYLVSTLQRGDHHARIAEVFRRTGFFDSVRASPFSRAAWRQAVLDAPTVKEDFHTVLSRPGAWEALEPRILDDEALAECFLP